MRTIYKFPLPDPGFKQTMALGNGIVRRVGCSYQNSPQVWVELESDSDTFELKDVTHEVHCLGTGQLIPDNTEYWGTYFNGPFVWHIYARDLRSKKTG
jgi:hypothetical protein